MGKNPFSTKNPFASNGNRLVKYSTNMDEPFIVVAKDLQFEIWQNDGDQFCSLGVKPAMVGGAIPIIVSMTAYYNGSIQTVVNKFNPVTNTGATDKSDYAVIDNDVGYGSGGAHTFWLMREDTGEPYNGFTCSTADASNEVTVAAMVIEFGGQIVGAQD